MTATHVRLRQLTQTSEGKASSQQDAANRVVVYRSHATDTEVCRTVNNRSLWVSHFFVSRFFNKHCLISDFLEDDEHLANTSVLLYCINCYFIQKSETS